MIRERQTNSQIQSEFGRGGSLEGERETDRQTDIQTDRQTYIQTNRQRGARRDWL